MFEESRTKRNLDKVTKMRKKINDYDSDVNLIKRKADCLCKYCTYIDTESIAGAAFTSTLCGNCRTMMTFASTNTDVYCTDCAKELNLCKHCGSVMD